MIDASAIADPPFRAAVAAVDAGDVRALDALLAAHPELVRDRLEQGEGYFRRPYLLWFVAENPVRTGRLPANVAEVARTILRAAERGRVGSLGEQRDYALSLVCSGRVPRECGVQRELLDLLVDAGADPNGALVPALAHRELAAAGRLLERGATLTLLAAACTGRTADVARLAPGASAAEREAALVGAAFNGRAAPVAALLALGADPSAFGAPGFHDHATALHHAVDSKSLDVVAALADAGASLDVKDRIYGATPLGWAEYLGHAEIAEYLRSRAGGPTAAAE